MKRGQYLTGRYFHLVIAAALMIFMSANPTDAQTLNPTKDKPLVLKFSTYAAHNTIVGKESTWWAQELEKRTGGRVKVEFYWAQSLVKVTESLDAVAKGIADLSFIPVAYFHGKLPLSSCTELIYVTDKPDAHAYACTELYKTYAPFRDEWEGQNLHVTQFHDSYSSVLITKKKVNSLEDIKGLKIRGIGLISEAIKLLGAVPVSLPGPEIYSAMERGVVDAVSGSAFDWTIAMRMYEVGPYITDAGVGIYITLATVMNNTLWKKLPDDIKAVIDNLGQEFPKKSCEIMMADNKVSIAKGVKEGAKLYTLPAQELQRWKNKVTPALWDNWLKSTEKPGVNVRECLKKFREILPKYEAKSQFIGVFDQYGMMVKAGEIK